MILEAFFEFPDLHPHYQKKAQLDWSYSSTMLLFYYSFPAASLVFLLVNFCVNMTSK
jgi:hypothetical protein